MIELTETEAMLYSTKWFDYRPYNPDGCNMVFVKAWLVAKEKMLQRTKLDVRFDEHGVQYRKPLPHANLAELKAETPTWQSLVMLRQFADKRGIPYDNFWSFAYSVLAERSIYQDEPVAIMQDTACKGSIVDLYNELFEARLIMSKEPNLRADAFVGLPFQIEYMRYVENEVHKRYPKTAQEKLAILVTEGRWISPLINPSIDQ